MQHDIRELLLDMQPDPDTPPALAAANAVEIQNTNLTPYQGNTVTKNTDQSYLGNKPVFNVAPNGAITFDTDFAQASAAGTAPAFSKLLRASGMAEVINAGTDVRYTPISEGFESIFARFIQSNEYEHDLNACKASFSLAMAAESRPLFSWSLLGAYRDVKAETAAITPDLSAWIDAVPVTKGNTPTLTIDGHQGCVADFNLDLSNDLQFYTEPGCEGVSLVNRAPSGSIVIAAPPIATKNFFDMAKSHEGLQVFPIQVVHGQAGLPLITVNIPRAQISGIQYENRRGALYIRLDYVALPSATGNDEIELIF